MDRRNLERIVLIILALLNVFLLSVVLSDTAEARRSAKETVASVTALLEDSGISVADGAITLQSAPAPCALARDVQREGEKVQKLIGAYTPEDLGGNIILYQGEQGKALLRGSGELDVLLSSSAVPLRRGAARTAQRALRQIGVTALPASEEGRNMDFYCTLEGIPVYNAVLHFEFSESSLVILTGTWLFDSVTKSARSTGMDSVSALLRFVEIVRSEGFICSRLDDVQPGYLLSPTRSGEAKLIPVWRIETDAGPLMIDADSGQVESRFT